MKKSGTLIMALAITASLLSAAEVDRRQARQQQRIGQGIESGQLTSREATRLEGKEANLRNEIRTDRQANGGKLTGQEKKQINRQENRLSRKIYQQKHDAQTAPR